MGDDEAKKAMNRLPPATLALVVLSTVVVFLVVLLVLYPQYRSVVRAKEARQASALELEKQKILFPVYVSALALDKKEFEPALGFPPRQPIGRNRIAELSWVLNGIAEECGMELSGNTLDINSMNKDSGTMAVEVTLKGDLMSFRTYLVKVMELPFFLRTESIRINSGDTHKLFSTKFRIAIEKK